MIATGPTPSCTVTERHASAAAVAALALGLIGSLSASPVYSQSADQTADPPDSEFAAGRGSIGVEFQHLYSHGDYGGPAGKNSGNVTFYTYELEASYFVAPGWEIDASLPYTSGKVTGNYPHPRVPCFLPSGTCGPTLVDDGAYHGTFSDWHAQLRYHADYAGFYWTPSVGIFVPSHNYPFYGSAVVGQRLTKYEVGLQLDHQFELSNFFYSARVLYVILPRTLGIDANYNRVGFDAGYFFSPQLAVRAITDVKFGHGITDTQINEALDIDGSSPLWQLHDKLRLEDNANVGAAVDYHFGADSNYQLSLSLLHSVWGRSNFDLKYDLGVRLMRFF
jgi:hypothetical protein